MGLFLYFLGKKRKGMRKGKEVLGSGGRCLPRPQGHQQERDWSLHKTMALQLTPHSHLRSPQRLDYGDSIRLQGFHDKNMLGVGKIAGQLRAQIALIEDLCVPQSLPSQAP